MLTGKSTSVLKILFRKNPCQELQQNQLLFNKIVTD